MSDAFLLLPDFLLIALGWLVCNRTPLSRPVWESVERLVYYFLFPTLLFTSTATSRLQPSQTATLGGAAVAVTVCGVALALALRAWPRVDAHRHASAAQVAFRFNSFIALALGERLAGGQGVAWMALMVALCVPVANVGAVFALARHGRRSVWRELAGNPLIIATVGGLICNALGVAFPKPILLTLQRIGGAALPLGLMAVGAGLRLASLQGAPGLAAALLAIRHAALPVVALALGIFIGLPPTQLMVLVTFCALPTASSAYVLAVRMGGDGPFVAGLVTVSTLVGMIGIPVWLAIVKAF